MESLLLPNKIVYHPDAHNPHLGSFVIEPCYYGYGTTLGNAIRRVLLSSLPGAAVTSLKITGADHEFSTISGVKEDVVELILNFKMLRMKVFSEEPVILKLHVKGEKVVTAADIEKNAQVEIVNKDLVLANLTDSKAELDIEITVAQGRGYVSTDAREKEKLDIGTVAIDSIFTPIVNVGFSVEHTRVGQITNFDKLTLVVETDGTITPEEAFTHAVDTLISHFQLIKGFQKGDAQDVSLSEEEHTKE